MTTIQEIAEKLAASHVISFMWINNCTDIDVYAGYSPANSLYWIGGVSYSTALLAATKMAAMGDWEEIDSCIDEDQDAAFAEVTEAAVSEDA
jgi:hypothetical protein